MVEKAGIKVSELLDLLVKNSAAEFTTYYYYTILRVNLIGMGGEGLGGKLPDDMKVFHDLSACPPATLPKDPTDMKAMLKVLVNAERCAVAGYSKICNLTSGKDHRTYDLSLAILHEEIEHESWFSEFLGEASSGLKRASSLSGMLSSFLRQVLFPQHFGEFDVPIDKPDTVWKRITPHPCPVGGSEV